MKMMIDVFAHIAPQKYVEAIGKSAPELLLAGRLAKGYPTLVDLDVRFKIMDRYESLVQVLSLGPPAVVVEKVPSPRAMLS